MTSALSFPKVSPFFAALGCSFPLFCLISLIRCDSFPALSISSICFLRSCTRPPSRYRLELEVLDDTAEVVVVMFNEMATTLVKCTADSIVEYEDQQGDEHSPLPQALANIVGTSHTLEFKSHTYYVHNTSKSFTCWRILTVEGMGESGGSSMTGGSHAFETPDIKRLLRHPSVTTPSKVDEAKKQKRGEAEESDDEASFVADTQAASGVGGSRPNTRKHKSWISGMFYTLQAMANSMLKDTIQERNYAENHSLANILQHSVRIQSNTIIRQDGRVQSYCGLQLKGIEASIPSTSRITDHGRTNLYQQAIAHTSNYPFSDAHRRRTLYPSMVISGGTTKSKSRNATKGVAFTSRGSEVSYHNIGAPSYQCVHCNATMCFTSFGARIDHSINNDRGVYTFKVNGQSYHRIGSLLPKEGTQPSSVAKAFRMAKDWCHSHGSVNIELHLLSERTNARQYNKPTVAEVAALITNDFGDGIPSRDIIVSKLHSGPKRISEFHPAYMALQYPLLFSYGEDGFHDKIPYYTNRGARKTNRGLVTMKEYYSYIIHQRNDQELPSQTEDPDGYKAVTDYMLHGPCGKDGKYAPCTTEGKCSKHYPKQFYAETVLDEYGYPIYRCRENKASFKKGKFTFDNRHVVPHNHYLLLKYQAHINVEWCNRSKAIKYLFKYLNKGPDRETVVIQENVRKVINVTMFTDWFDLNERGLSARTLTYADLPKLYVWHEQLKMWKPRKQKKCIGRIVYSTPASGERYFLRMLLNVVRGPKVFDELMTVNNRLCHIFKEACFAYGLLNDDMEWTKAISEVSLWALGPQLRDLFVTILLFCDVSRPLKLWEETWEYLSEDILHKKRKLYDYPDLQLSIEQIQNYCLVEIQELLNRIGRSLTDFQDLPRLNPQLLKNIDNRLIREA
ncbi:ATP-dependent DNA helicase PIF1-like protein [Tanacetum coccineum]